MRKIHLLLVILTFIIGVTNNVVAQTDNISLITLGTYIEPDVSELSESSTSVLENMLSQVISNNGMTSGTSRFIIAANVVVITKEILPTAPSTFSYTLAVTMHIGDGIAGNKFASHTLNLKGVGSNQTKAIINALKNINANDKGLQAFVTKGKAQILNYYNTKCDMIIKEAGLLSKQNNFDEAIFWLMTVPDGSSCYDKVLSNAEEIYTKKINTECKEKLQEANIYWSANPTVEGANEVANILATIDTNSSCISEVKELVNKVSKRIMEIDGREWNFVLDTKINLEKDRIKAIKDIGVAWGNGQPNTITYNTKSWW